MLSKQTHLQKTGKIQSVAHRSGLMCCGGSNRNESKNKPFFFVPVVIGHIVKAVK